MDSSRFKRSSSPLQAPEREHRYHGRNGIFKEEMLVIFWKLWNFQNFQEFAEWRTTENAEQQTNKSFPFHMSLWLVTDLCGAGEWGRSWALASRVIVKDSIAGVSVSVWRESGTQGRALPWWCLPGKGRCSNKYLSMLYARAHWTCTKTLMPIIVLILLVEKWELERLLTCLKSHTAT